VPIDRLARFFRNPCRYLLEQRLGLELRCEEEELRDEEPYRPVVTGRAPLVDLLLPAFLEGMSLASARELARAGADVPDGAFGRHVLERELHTLHDFAQQVRGFTAPAALAPHAAVVEVEVDGATWRVHGAFAELRPGGLLSARFARLGPAAFLDAWLPHLLLCATAPEGVSPLTTGIARDGRFELRACPEPRAVLAALVGLYARGLREPLPFFPKASWTLVDGGLDIARAAQEFRPGATTPGAAWAESADAGIRLALRGRPDPFGPAGASDLVACARAVFDPLRACLAREEP
jgi:exodeoxyribonuclease V gamma subunit